MTRPQRDKQRGSLKGKEIYNAKGGLKENIKKRNSICHVLRKAFCITSRNYSNISAVPWETDFYLCKYAKEKGGGGGGWDR